jgi:ABC-2 type transport system permease protein
MPVFERTYRAWDGPRVPPARLWTVVMRHAVSDMFQSRLTFLVFCASFLLPLGAAGLIYLRHNVAALTSMQVDVSEIGAIDGPWFFAGFMAWQCYWFGGLLALLAGPSLVSADLSHGALPLFLARPLTRTRYVAGKLVALAGVLSLVTWVPGLLLFALQGSLEGWGWVREHARIAPAIFLGSLAWIAVLSLLTLAASAVTRRKATAQMLLVAVVFGGQVVGGAVREAFGSSWGFMLSIPEVMHSLVQGLYGVEIDAELSTGAALLAVPLLCTLCLFVLARRLKAVEIVR